MFQHDRVIIIMHGLLFKVSFGQITMMRRSILALMAGFLVAQGTIRDGDRCDERESERERERGRERRRERESEREREREIERDRASDIDRGSVCMCVGAYVFWCVVAV